MLKNVGCFLIAAGSALGAAGCGGVEGYYPVSGKVLYKGEPAAGAVVYLHREGTPDPAHAEIPRGVVDRYGDFQVRSEGIGPGAPAGPYAVLIEWRAAPADSSEAPPARPGKKGGPNRVDRFTPDRLKGRYFDRNAPRFHAEIKPESNTLPTFELAD